MKAAGPLHEWMYLSTSCTICVQRLRASASSAATGWPDAHALEAGGSGWVKASKVATTSVRQSETCRFIRRNDQD